jgi:hypothetical protein
MISKTHQVSEALRVPFERFEAIQGSIDDPQCTRGRCRIARGVRTMEESVDFISKHLDEFLNAICDGVYCFEGQVFACK